MSVKLLTEHYLEFLSLKGGCTCSTESTLVKMSHCWKSHVTAHIYVFLCVCVSGTKGCLTLAMRIVLLKAYTKISDS